MAMTARIQKETKNFITNPVPGVHCEADEQNFRHFYAKISGPGGTPYEDGIFNLELFLPEGYPMEPPKVLFRTKIYHPNIDKLGRICLSILKDNGFSPALTMQSVLISIQSLLSEPNLDDPLE